MKLKIFCVGISILSMLLISGCVSSDNEGVKDIKDADIFVDPTESMEDIAKDIGLEDLDSGLIDVGDLAKDGGEDPLAPKTEDNFVDVGFEELDADLIEFRELI